MSRMCLRVTPAIQELTDKIQQAYPIASQRNNFSADMCAEFIGAYNSANNKQPDFVPSMSALLNFIEKRRNIDGKSFFRDVDEEFLQMSVEPVKGETVTYNLPGQDQQTYTISDTHIYNKNGEEVFKENDPNSKTHRYRIFANLAVQQGRAVVVNYKGSKYVVNKENMIMSASGKNPGHIMGWRKENGDRKAILALAQTEFGKIQKTTTTPDISKEIAKQLDEHFVKEIGLEMGFRKDMEEDLKKRPNADIQQISDGSNPDIQMAIEDAAPSESEQLSWVEENKNSLVEEYIAENGNVFNPDNVREMLSPIGYTKDRVNEFYKAGNALCDHVLNAMFDRLAKSDNKTVSIITGAPGSGKGHTVEGRKSELSGKGLVIDSPFHSSATIQGMIDRARKAGAKDSDIQAVFVYNDFETAYKNAISRGKKTGRFLSLSYYITAFRNNKNVFSEIYHTNPDINYVTIDNSGNQNNEVSPKEADNWNYDVNNELIKKITYLIEDDNEIRRETKLRILDWQEGIQGKRGIRKQDAQTSRGGLETYRGRTKGEVRSLLSQRLGLSLPESEQEKLDDLIAATETFLDNFSITLNDASEYEGEVPLFDALNRAINIRTADDITEGVGQAIAFMMQYSPAFKSAVEARMLDNNPTALKGIRRALKRRGSYDITTLKPSEYKRLNRAPFVKLVGSDIAKELRKFYNLQKPEDNNSYFKKIWDIIIDFFKSFSPQVRNMFREAYNFSSNAAFAVASNNDRFIRYSNLKPGSEKAGEAELVDIGKALLENPYEESIIRELNEEGIGLAGGASIASFGVLMRPVENPLHDLDFNAANVCETPEDVEKVVNKHFQYNRKTNSIVNSDSSTETYLILDRPFKTEVIGKSEKGRPIYGIFDASTNKQLGSYYDSELTLVDGVQGKFLDFFIGEGSKSKILTKEFNGTEYKIADYNRAFQAKIDWQREKDVWDYNNFRKFDDGLRQEFIHDGKEIYGYADENGKIFIDETVASPEHRIHEYTHLWDRAVRKHNPRLWRRGVALLKETGLWADIENRPEYGQKWKKAGITGEELEFRIASEVHARLVGENGEKFMIERANELGSDSLIGKIKKWILDVWKDLLSTFSNISDEELDKLTLADFDHMTVRDLVNGVNPNTIQSQAENNVLGPETKINIYAGTNENADLSNFAVRQFTIDVFADDNQYLKIGRRTKEDDKYGVSPDTITFQSVEQAFQYYKTLYSKSGLNKQEVKKIQDDIMSTTNGSSLRSLGRKVTLDTFIWDLSSSNIMKNLILESFKQNPQALQRLLATGNATLTHTQDKGKWGTEFPKLLMEVRDELRGNTINKNNNRSNNKIEYGNEFRRIQEAVREGSQGVGKSVTAARVSPEDRQRLSRVVRDELRSKHSSLLGVSRADLTGKGNKFTIHREVDPQLFHDIFEVVRYYTENAELVDLHDDYSNCKCYLNDDGTCGFAIEPDGNLVSLFNLGIKKGFLYAIKDFVVNEGANHLDAFASKKQNLRLIYEKILGAKVAATMDYNMKYDQDNIAEKHGSPEVVFMVMGKDVENTVEEKHFSKDQYDEAQAYQHSFLPKGSSEKIFQSTSSFDKSQAEFYSGAARGSDTVWGSIARAMGIKVQDYTWKEYREIPREYRNDVLETEYIKVRNFLGKPVLRIGMTEEQLQSASKKELEKNPGILTRRDMMQADKADAVFAIAKSITPPGGIEIYKRGEETTEYTNYSGHDNVEGGTANAVARGILRGIPVYVFDQSDSKWKTWDSKTKKFVETEEPVLTPHAAVIGTEQIKSNGIAAIRSILSKTLGEEAPSGAAVNTGSLNDIPTGNISGGGRFRTQEELEAAQAISAQEAERREAQEAKKRPPRKHSDALESALKPVESRTADFSRTFSPQQIKDRGAMIADMFSDIIEEALYDELDELYDTVESDSSTEEQKEDARTRINVLRDPLEGRQKAAEKYTIPRIIKDIIEKLEYGRDMAADDNTKILWQNTIDYFEELFNSQASLDIEEREGIRIIGLEFAKQNVSDDENKTQDDGDDDVGHIASGSDGWSFQIRFTNPFDALSKRVRSMMYEITKPDSEKDDLGYTRKYPMGQIYASLLSYLSKNMQSPDAFLNVVRDFDELPETMRGSIGNINSSEDFKRFYPNGYPVFPVLEKMTKMYPWTGQLIDRLTDDYLSPEYNGSYRYPSTGGSMASQFYTNFRKAFIPYAKIMAGIKEGIIPLNFQMEDKVQKDKLEANYNNRMILTDTSIYNADGKVNKEHAETLKAKIKAAITNIGHFYEIPALIEYDAQQKNEEDKVLSKEDVEEYNEFIDNVRNIMQSFGIDATQESVTIYLLLEDKGSALSNILNDLEGIADKISKLDDSRIDSFNYITDTNDQYGNSVWAHFFDNRGMISDVSYMQSYYDSASKKTKYSYSADNYLMKTFRGVAMGTKEERQKYIEEKYGKYAWFRDQNTGEWKNKWLEFWYNYDGDASDIPYRNIDNITEADNKGNIKVRQYVNWELDDIWMVQDRSYDAKSERSRTSHYLAPIFSDSPMSMTVKGPRMDMNDLLFGRNDENGIYHKGALVSLIDQEIGRIELVGEREKLIKQGKIKAIVNFDGNRGKQFCFIPELNDYVCENGEKFIDRMASLKKEGASAKEIEAVKIKALQDIIDYKKKEYIHENASHYGRSEDAITDEQYYNMVYAGAAIIQLTTIDLAFYKSDADFQKRFKEVYAGGIQLNTNSKYGMKTENVILLADDIITSPSYKSIASLIDGFPNLTKEDKEDIKSIFREVNVADAQAIRSMDSFRSILDMMGRWDDRMEEALNNFKNKTWKKEDFDIIYQTIKPFVYAVIDRNDGLGNKIAVPQQNKNSEICALMMYDLISNSLGESDVYVALSEFMDETKDSEGNTLIHMCGYESMGKVGNQGVINISIVPSKLINAIDGKFGDTEEEKELKELFEKADLYPAYIEYKDNSIESLPNDVDNAIRNFSGEKISNGKIKGTVKQQLDDKLENGTLTQEEYNKIIAYLRPDKEQIKEILRKAALITNSDGSLSINEEVVHTIPMDNYYQAQPTPAHHVDAEATFGSQARNINVADLPDNFEITLKGKNGKSKKYKGRDAVIDFYYELLNENLIEDFFGITDDNGKLKLNKKGEPIKAGLKNLFASKKNLRDAVSEIVRGNPKYGNDFADALELDSEGNFVLSPNSPTMFNLMQEIITSFFKNRITKQTINGAALIQAAGIGLDENLRVLTDEKTGKVIGAECYMPLTSKKFFEPLLEDKIVNGKKQKVLELDNLPDDLRKAIGYRIPTENKSSMMPLIIKGFTPLQNGSVIVLPAEITAIAGSDFDVDKMFIMLLSFDLITEDKKRAFNDYVAEEHEAAQKVIDALGSANIEDLELEELGQNFNEWYEERKDKYKLDKPRIRKIEYDFSKTPKQNGRKARNNMLIQLMYGILTSKEGSEQLLNPQGFKDFKHAAKINCILNNSVLIDKLIKKFVGLSGEGVAPSAENIKKTFLDMVKEKYSYKFDMIRDMVNKMSNEQVLDAYMKALNPNSANEAIAWLLDPKTKTGDIEDFINGNSPAESPIYPQTFAHSHAKNMAGTNQIGIYALQCSMSAKYQRASVVMKEEQRYNLNGRDIDRVDVSEGGKRLKNGGQMVGASADNGKDANLSDAGSTSNTAPIIGYLLRSGMSHLEAVFTINQPCMLISGYSAGKIKSSYFGKLDPLAYPMEPITTSLLVKSIVNPMSLTSEEDLSIAAMCYKILKQHEAQEYLTKISRADSPNGSIQNTYAKARIQIYKVDLFQAKMGQDDFPFIRINEALSNDAVDTSADENTVRKQVNSQRMGFLHAMYALGIHSFNDLVAPYFFGARKSFDDAIIKPILYNLDEHMSDEQKETIVNAAYTSYITFVLSGSPLFGNEENVDGTTYSMKEKREYYLETFPSEYQKIIADNKDIRDTLSSILQVIQVGGRKRIVMKDASSVGKKQKADIQRRFEKLAYSDNKVARKLAADLFVYSYFDNGLNFRHDSFSHLFTTKFLLHFPVYNEALRKLDEDLPEELNRRFIEQFLITFPQAAYKASFVNAEDNVYDDGATLIFSLNDRKTRKKLINVVTSPNPHKDGINVYPYLNYNGNIYILNQEAFDADPSTAVYSRVAQYPTFPKLPLFSMQMSAGEMAEEFKAIEPVDSEGDIPEGQIFNDPYIGNNFFAPDFGDSLGDNFSGAGIDFYMEPVSDSDRYYREGEGELQSPFC